MLRGVMQAKKPTRKEYLNDDDYQYELNRWETNPIYGWIYKNVKADGTPYNIYSDGLKIYTTINSSMQRYAEEAVAERLKNEIQPYMDAQFKRTGVVFQDQSKDQINTIIANAMRYSGRYREMEADGASRQQIEAAFNTPVEMQLFTYKGLRDTIITPRDSIIHFKKIMRASFVAIEPRTGHMKAYVGGPNSRYFKYDNAKQGKRQCGSTIKPFVYTFAFSQLGLDPCTPVPNLPVTIETTTATGEPWTPKEAGQVEYDGVMNPLKWGLAHSRNNYTAWIMKHTSPQAVADFIHNMGIRSWIDPVHALALGTMDVSLFELVGAYTTFANEGVSTEPIFVTRIEDRQGNLISSFLPESIVAINEQTAYTTLQVLEEVVNHGTAYRLRGTYGFTAQMGGKTGTSQDSRDAWFVGVTPNLVAGAWVGGEDQSVHPERAGEGSVIALPIYGEFMRRVYADPKLGVLQTDKFEVPPGAVTYRCEKVNDLAPAIDNVPNDEFFD
jgi:penicillin-binding protein 1A